MKSNKKGFFRCICSKRNTGKNMHYLLSGEGELMTKETRPRYSMTSLSQSLVVRLASRIPIPEIRKLVSKEDLPSMEEVNVK